MAHDPATGAQPPRVIIAMPHQWTRALLRAALREEGYDAVGARGLREAFRIRPVDPERGPVRLLIIDQDALPVGADALLARLSERLGGPDAVLVKRATRPLPNGHWRRVLQRPVSVADVVDTARALVPLPAAARHPVD
jgi:hypothetical protein